MAQIELRFVVWLLSPSPHDQTSFLYIIGQRPMTILEPSALRFSFFGINIDGWRKSSLKWLRRAPAALILESIARLPFTPEKVCGDAHFVEILKDRARCVCADFAFASKLIRPRTVTLGIRSSEMSLRCQALHRTLQAKKSH